ncbi:MAG: MATE family efflux transporter [Prevotellaceae bacterium]|jgi:putative MATE family efflux protein|nr:MATE family efflux transporter [Prevotellaceae bacterium]
MTDKNNPAVLGTENIGKLLMQYSIPAIMAMVAASLYNIVDRIFIGNAVGPLAISGLAITFPLMNISAAFGSLIGAGGSTLVAIKMGQKDNWGANQILGNAIMLNLILGSVIMIFGLLFLNPILYCFGATENTIDFARDYMQIILGGNVITHVYLGMNNIMRSSGYPRKAMYTTFIAVIINAVLDIIFIFEFGWGIRGAAIATVIAQTIALIWVSVHFMNKNSFIRFQKGIYTLKKRIVSGIFSIGMSPFILNVCSCLVVILFNTALLTYGGDLAIGAFGITNSVVMFFVMVVLGLTQGMQPVAGYNFGAKQFDRVLKVLNKSIIAATCITTIAFIVSELFPQQLAMLFSQKDNILSENVELTRQQVEYAVTGLRITLAVFPIVGISMVIANFFQSIGKAKHAIFLSTTRQLIFLIPLILILPKFWGLTGVWLSIPISDFISTVLAVILMRRQFKILKKQTS